MGGVPRHAAEGQVEGVRCGERHVRIEPDLAAVQRDPVVEPEDGVHPGVLHDSVLDHGRCADQKFLGRLEDELDAAPDAFAELGQDRRHAEHDGRMHVVAAGVHAPGHLGGEGRAALFLDGKRIHVGADAHGPARPAALDDADDAGFADARLMRDAQFVEDRRDPLRRLHLFEPGFRMPVDGVPDFRELAFDAFGDSVDGLVEVHCSSSLSVRARHTGRPVSGHRRARSGRQRP